MKIRRLAWGLAGGAGALFLLGTNVQAGWLIVIASLCAGALIAGMVLPSFAMRGISVRRAAPAEAEAGAAVPVSLVVRNSARSMRGLIEVRDHFLGEGRAVVRSIAPGQEIEYAGRRRGARRGVYTRGTCELQTGVPFGVRLARRLVDVPARTVVYPRICAVDIEALLRGGESAAAARPRKAPSGDTASVREYRRGDPLRHVHWRSTAKTGRIVVRELEESSGADLAVAAGTSGDTGVLDAVASAACSLALAALDRGRSVEVAAGPDRASRRDVLEWGARLSEESPPLAASLGGIRSRAVACALAADDTAGLAGLRRMANSGVSVVAVVVDTASAPARDAAEGLRSAGATVLCVPATDDLSPWLTWRR